jgi:hypothetical protein
MLGVSLQEDMIQPQRLAYLDHNVLDLMTKGDPHRVAHLLKKASLTPVYSNENLAEIRRSVGYEKTFLNVLHQIGAQYLVPILDKNFKQTGTAEVRVVNPFDAFSSYIDNVDSLPEFGFGLSGMLQKFYGGREDQSFEEIFLGGVKELGDLLASSLAELESSPEVTEEVHAALEEAVALLPEILREQYKSVALQLNPELANPIKSFEQATGIGPIVLKNIRGPDVVRKIWSLVQERLPGPEIDQEVFFGIKPFPFEADADRARTMPEKVNGIYHQLNFLGYYRDSNMNKQRRFTASFSDMTHAGLASFCHILICRDNDLVMKAAAAYEYLGVGTRVVHFGGKNNG